MPNESSSVIQKEAYLQTRRRRLSIVGPLDVVGKVLIMDTTGVVHDGGHTPEQLLRAGATVIHRQHMNISQHTLTSGLQTHLLAVRIDATKLNSVTSASVGSDPPSTQNGPAFAAAPVSCRTSSSRSLKDPQISRRNDSTSADE